MGRNGKGERPLVTTCYYLLTYKDRCIFHKLRSEEIWFFLHGDPLEFHEICEQSRTLSKTILGPDVYKGHKLKHNVKAGTWFGALPQVKSVYCLLSCVVLPGFKFEDWEKGNPSYLFKICPQAEESIRLLT